MTSEQHTCFCFHSGKCALLERVIHMPARNMEVISAKRGTDDNKSQKKTKK